MLKGDLFFSETSRTLETEFLGAGFKKRIVVEVGSVIFIESVSEGQLILLEGRGSDYLLAGLYWVARFGGLGGRRGVDLAIYGVVHV